MKFDFNFSFNKIKCNECGKEFPIPYVEENKIKTEGCRFDYTFDGVDYSIKDGEIKLNVPSLSKMSDYKVTCICGNEVFNSEGVTFVCRKKPESEKSTLRKVIEALLLSPIS